jgi:hypothetical protein
LKLLGLLHHVSHAFHRRVLLSDFNLFDFSAEDFHCIGHQRVIEQLLLYRCPPSVSPRPHDFASEASTGKFNIESPGRQCSRQTVSIMAIFF